jgi:hypothetical protein
MTGLRMVQNVRKKGTSEENSDAQRTLQTIPQCAHDPYCKLED